MNCVSVDGPYKRTFEYEPFLRTFVERLNREGLLKTLLHLDEDGQKIKAKQRATGNKGKEKR